MRALFRRLLLLLALALPGHSTFAAVAYSIAIVPQYTPMDIGLRWTPLLQRLQRETGVVLQIRTDSSIAFPAPDTFGASRYMRALLRDKEKIAFKPSHVGKHQNVYRSVLYGAAPAGGGVSTIRQSGPAAVRERLKVIYRPPEFTSFPLAVHPRAPKAVVDKAVQPLKRIGQDPQGRKCLDQAGLHDLADAGHARDYAPLEQLKLERQVSVKNH
jgi:ABC-type phosphate/phosphonate transport system substrate-binding protein